MAKGINKVTRVDLEQLTTAEYVSHKEVMDMFDAATTGMTKIGEIYELNEGKTIASGTLVFTNPNTTEAEPLADIVYSWVNTYESSIRFKCSVGIRVQGGVVANHFSTRIRKGTLLAQITEQIKTTVDNTDIIVDELTSDLAYMKSQPMGDMHRALALGELFITHDHITSTELMSVKKSIAATDNTVEVLYLQIIKAMQGAHPKHWMEKHMAIHKYMKKTFFPQPVQVDPNQLDIEQEAANAERSELVTLGEGIGFNPIPDSKDLSLDILDTLGDPDDSDVEDGDLTDNTEPSTTIVDESPEMLMGGGLLGDPEVAEDEVTMGDPDLEGDNESLKGSATMDQSIININPPEQKFEIVDQPSTMAYNSTDEEPVQDTESEEISSKEFAKTLEEERLSIEVSSNKETLQEIPSDEVPKQTSEFKSAPEAMPEASFPSLEDAIRTEAIPLEEQVAKAEPEPVTLEEEAISKDPVVDEPVAPSGESFIPPVSNPGAFQL